MTKRIWAMVLVLAMVMSMVPSVVTAEGPEITITAKAGTHTDAAHAGDCGVTTGWDAWGDDPEEQVCPLPVTGICSAM